MKPDAKLHFTIIGLGNLMEVIWPCLTGTLGGADLSARAIGTTADEDDIHRKRDFFQIPVQLGENLAALKSNQPDIIFFAPPPTIAPGEIERTLKPYCTWAREHNLHLPEIYAFPPVPKGEYYREILGTDVLVTNIIPNNVTQIAGNKVIDEGYYACSFDGSWSPESKARLKRLFDSQGAMVELPVDKLVPMLGGTCAFFVLWQVIPVLAEILQKNGHSYSHNQIGEHLRGLCQQQSGFIPQHSTPASPIPLPEQLDLLLMAMASAWRKGVTRYYQDIDFPPQSAAVIVERGFDVILHTVQREPRSVLDNHAIGAATKGGVLEKATATFHKHIKPLLEESCADLEHIEIPVFQAELTKKVSELAHIVGQHGQKLAG